ncbi:hypothetical protein B7463_g5110, partial [Scytalidium lignicola]
MALLNGEGQDEEWLMDEAESDREESGSSSNFAHKPKQTHWGFLGSVCLNLLFISYILFSYLSGLRQSSLQTPIYSPAASAIEYMTVTFNPGDDERGSQSPYFDLSDSADALWEDLDRVILQIDKKSAQKLPVKTLGIPGIPGFYVITLDVFHQLHCLNLVRKSLFPERYNLWDGIDENYAQRHQLHCIDQLRQSITCSADIAPIPWKWVEEAQQSFPTSETIHTCRNFTNIRNWAAKHALPGGFNGFDSKTRVEW